MDFNRVRMCNQIRKFRRLYNSVQFPELYTNKSGTVEFRGFVNIFFTMSNEELRNLVLLSWYLYVYIIQYYYRVAMAVQITQFEIDHELCSSIYNWMYTEANELDACATIFTRAINISQDFSNI